MVRMVFLVLSLSAFSVFAEKIVVLGDSLSFGRFGERLKAKIEESDRSHELNYYVSSGGSPYYWLDSTERRRVDQKWLQTGRRNQYFLHPTEKNPQGSLRDVPKMDELFDWHAPDVVVVQSGNNLFGTLRKYGADTVKRRVRELVERIVDEGGSECYWILPPSADTASYSQARQDAMERVLLEATGQQCPAFRSRLVTKKPVAVSGEKYDGVHYGPKEYEAWADHASQWLVKKIGGEEKKPVLRAVPIAQSRSILPPAGPSMNGSHQGMSLQPSGSIQKAKPPAFVLAPLETEEPIRAVRAQKFWVNLELVQKSRIPDLRDVAYREYLAVYQYKSLKSGATYLVEHFVLKDLELTAESQFKVGDQFSMLIEVPPESLSTLGTVDDINDFDSEYYFSNTFKKIN